MKTKIKTIIAICALGIIGFTNINATADNKKLVNAEVVTEKEEMLTIESWMIDESFWTSETKVATAEAEEALEIESWMTNESFWTSGETLAAVETEEPLEIESWMTNEDLWK
jgi:hypothetical protein